jgi:intracellular sulfur oxidation DsrE/DsrF family protein
MKHFAWLVVAVSACGSSVRRSTPPQPEVMSGVAVVAPTAYNMCDMKQASDDSLAASQMSFELATKKQDALDLKGAAKLYIEGAQTLAAIKAPQADIVVYNRRVAYANAVNLWLNAKDIEAARAAILSAAKIDLDMADELKIVANNLPSPMACIGK